LKQEDQKARRGARETRFLGCLQFLQYELEYKGLFEHHSPGNLSRSLCHYYEEVMFNVIALRLMNLIVIIAEGASLILKEHRR